MSLVVYSGAIQFIAVAILASPFDPIGTFAVSLLVGARHIFYGISMLDRYKATGARKWLLMHTLTDETFSVNISNTPPPGVDSTSFYLSVSLLDLSYWCVGSAIGAIVGSALSIDVKGIDFALTALFVVIFTEQWLKERDHKSSLLGVAATALSLAAFGKGIFIVASMAIIIAVLVAMRSKFEEAAE